MSLDWFAGQRCALRGSLGAWRIQLLRAMHYPIPRLGTVYVIDAVIPCSCCGVEIAPRALGGKFYPASWFRPIDFAEMDVLRAALKRVPLRGKAEVC